VGAALLVIAGCGGLNWQEYTSNEGGFTVLLPGAGRSKTHTVQPSKEFKEKMETEKTPVGPVTMNTTVVELPEGAFLVAWADLPANMPLDLDARLDALAGRYRGPIARKEKVEFLGTEGREFEIDTRNPPGEAVGRLYQVKNRLYQLLVVGSHVRASSAEVRRFLDSFRLGNPLLK
jgi:hypothetical protein